MFRFRRIAVLLSTGLLACRLAPAQSAAAPSPEKCKPAYLKARLLKATQWQLAHPLTDWTVLAWGINQGILPKSTHLPPGQKAWVALDGCVSAEGRGGWVQPIGVDPRRDFSTGSWEVYGTGTYLLAGSEVSNLNR